MRISLLLVWGKEPGRLTWTPQIGSHYHFIEVNPRLRFDRAKAYGKRLDIASGTAIRFEPGDSKTVTLVEIGGRKYISGGNSLATGVFDSSKANEIVNSLVGKDYGHVPEPGALEVSYDTTLAREAYVSMFGPTTGDRVRLGDTALWIEVEKDFVSNPPLFTAKGLITLKTVYGDEVKFGGGEDVSALDTTLL